MVIYTQEADRDSITARLELISCHLLDDPDSPATSPSCDRADYGRIFNSLSQILGSQNSNSSEAAMVSSCFPRAVLQIKLRAAIVWCRKIRELKAKRQARKRRIITIETPDERLEPNNNNNKRKCPSYQSNFPSKSTRHPDNLLVPDSEGIVTGKTISNLPENNVYEQDALPGVDSEPGNHGSKYEGSQSNYPPNMMNSCYSFTLSNLTEMFMCESIPNFPEKGSAPSIPGATRTLSSLGSRNTFLESRDSHVTVRIKSFTVPEFSVEISETATISLLKRRIMEKATAVVGGGAHVDVLLQGEKIRDENKILSETGISGESRLDVILEPKPSQALLCLPCDIPHPQARYSPAPAVVHQGAYDTSTGATDPLFCNLGNNFRGDELVESGNNMSIGKSTSSREISVFPCIDVEALDMDPMPQKSKSSKKAQRRKPKPFPIPEVEKLVREVEKLGTGRWQEIKEQAFGNDSNRTRTDLKDKWTSLVKTAKRPANQRRGPVIPQELLDRVLAVETHNSQLQAIQ